MDYYAGIVPTRDELERLSTFSLALLCEKAAKSHSATSAPANQAREMKREWELLMASMTPRPSTLEGHKDFEAKRDKLRRKMISFSDCYFAGHVNPAGRRAFGFLPD